MFEIRVEDSFAAAHFLTHFHGKCERLHGHNYRVRIFAEGETLGEGGLLLDFGVLKQHLKNVLKTLDHYHLNENPWFSGGDPSAELIALYIYENLMKEDAFLPISRVEVYETEKNRAAYIV